MAMEAEDLKVNDNNTKNVISEAYDIKPNIYGIEANNAENQIHVLVVDDRLLDRKIVERLLKSTDSCKGMLHKFVILINISRFWF